MKTGKHIFAVLLVLFAVVLSACSAASGNDNETVSGEIVSDTVAEETAEKDYSLSDLPAMDFNGAVFTDLCPDEYLNSWNPTVHIENPDAEILSDPLNAAIYNRNLAISERYNMSFHEVHVNGGLDAFTAAVLSGDDVYQLFTAPTRQALTCTQDGLSLPLSELKYVDLTKPYWSATLNNNMTIHNKLNFCFGDFNMTSYDATVTLLFNKPMYDNYFPEMDTPYAIVKKGTWVYDTVMEMMTTATVDLNGDGRLSTKDQFGFTSAAKEVLPSFWIAAGQKIITKDEADTPVFSAGTDTEFIAVFQKIMSTMHDNRVWNEDTSLFSKDQALFTFASFRNIASLRDMDSDFGILPFPKWTEEQEDYYTRVFGGGVSIVSAAVKDPDFVSFIMEALACEARKTTVPAYYEIALKSKSSRDEESAAMLDFIFSKRQYDLGDTFWNNIIRDGFIKGMFLDNDMNIVSKVAEQQSAVNEAIQKSVEAFDKLK